MRTTKLESCHEISRSNPAIEWGEAQIVGPPGAKYRVTSAPCGCENRTRIIDGMGPSCDGLTSLCQLHAIHEEEDDDYDS